MSCKTALFSGSWKSIPSPNKPNQGSAVQGSNGNQETDLVSHQNTTFTNARTEKSVCYGSVLVFNVHDKK